ncbi:MAG: beta-propeller domain-containing protein [Clostridia bacterium]|nr:beta-propeller domain-containing protein [Clostridia bacterium]
MKNRDLFNAIGNVDPDMIAAADLKISLAAKRKKRRLRAFAVFAACFTLMIGATSLWLFMPYELELPESILEQKDNEFFDVYVKVNGYLSRNLPKNNYEKYVEQGILKYYYELHRDEKKGVTIMGGDDGIDSAEASPEVSPEGTYIEVTDNQVDGIIEPDLFKRTDTHLFYLSINDGRCIYAYTIDGAKSELCGVYNDFSKVGRGSKFRPRGMYLSEDGKTLIIISTHWEEGTEILFVDVSDPTKMTRERTVSFRGRCSESRLKDGKLYVAYTENFSMDASPGYESVNCVRPSGVMCRYYQEFTRDEIVVTERSGWNRYFVLLQIDVEKCKVDDKLALLSFADDVFAMFDDRILVGYEYGESDTKIRDTYPVTVEHQYTDFAVISYGDSGFEMQGTFTVEGRLVNRYAIDLDGDVARVVATAADAVRNSITYEAFRENISCDLLCYDIISGKNIAAIKSFAPEDEDVKSVRFDGDTVYVCTAKVEIDENGKAIILDPVYFFDVSDYRHITSIDTGTIEGYSSSLKPFGNGMLLGIGYGTDYGFFDDTLKVEIYAENGDKVDSVCAYERVNIWFAKAYQSYYLDSENGYIGIAFTDRERPRGEQGGYILLGFDGEKIAIIAEEYFDKNGDHEHSRSIVIDGYLYIMYEDEFRVIKVE